MFLHGQVDIFWKSLFPNDPKSLHCYIAIACCPSWHNIPVLSPKQAKFSHQHFNISSWFLSGFHICKDASTSLSVCKPDLDNLHKHRKNLHDTNIEAHLAEGNQCFLSSMEKCTRSMPTSRLLLCIKLSGKYLCTLTHNRIIYILHDDVEFFLGREKASNII